MALTEDERVRAAAFAITARFEGGGYDTYQNHDAGIVSYGRFQFTLAAGTLGTIVTRYLERTQSAAAERLRPYQARILNRDPALRGDTELRAALIAAAREPVMQQVQDELATESYWQRTHQIAIVPRGIQLPLSRALLFDVSVNFGVGDGFLRMAERDFGVPPRSRLVENGISEDQLIRRVTELRKLSHDRQAERDRLPGLRVRGAFWLGLVDAGDWQLQGDVNGNVSVNGALVQVRSPADGQQPTPPPPGPLRITPAGGAVNLRDRATTSGSTVLLLVRPGDVLTVTEDETLARLKIGSATTQQWVAVRTADGVTGFTAAWLYQVVE
jgi:hypothetical protein